MNTPPKRRVWLVRLWVLDDDGVERVHTKHVTADDDKIAKRRVASDLRSQCTREEVVEDPNEKVPNHVPARVDRDGDYYIW